MSVVVYKNCNLNKIQLISPNTLRTCPCWSTHPDAYKSHKIWNPPQTRIYAIETDVFLIRSFSRPYMKNDIAIFTTRYCWAHYGLKSKKVHFVKTYSFFRGCFYFHFQMKWPEYIWEVNIAKNFDFISAYWTIYLFLHYFSIL